MWCDPPSIPVADVPQPTQSDWPKQLSFMYQPGVGLYDKKKIDLDQDLRITSTTADVDERIQALEISTFTSDVDHRSSSNLYKSYLRRQNEQDSIPIRESSSNEILSDKSPKSSPINKPNHSHIKLFDINISANQENNQKRKFDQNLCSNKKLRHSSISTKQQSTSLNSSNENLLDKELNHQKSKLITTKEQQSSRTNSNERLHKQSLTTIIKNIPMVKKMSSEKEGITIPSQGLLLCPKEEPIKKKKKKKIAPTISSSTALLDDDPVLDSILFDEIQSVQQQWQQFLILTMEKELHINPSDGKKKIKLNKFNRTNEFLLAYENLYHFEGMKHWYPTST